MGTGYSLHCRKCGYKISAGLGIGYMYPLAWKQTMEEARAGEYGETIRRFLEEHPDGTLIPENVLLQCTSCGNLDSGVDLSMYIRRPEVSRREHGRWSVAAPNEGAEYVSPMDRDDDQTYVLYARGNICEKCGKLMRPITDKELDAQRSKGKGPETESEIPCPKCGELLWFDESGIMWD